LKRNRHYEDKYGEGKESSPERRREWWDENVARRAPDVSAAPSPRTQTWESSYVVTPNPEWFR